MPNMADKVKREVRTTNKGRPLKPTEKVKENRNQSYKPVSPDLDESDVSMIDIKEKTMNEASLNESKLLSLTLTQAEGMEKTVSMEDCKSPKGNQDEADNKDVGVGHDGIITSTQKESGEIGIGLDVTCLCEGYEDSLGPGEESAECDCSKK